MLDNLPLSGVKTYITKLLPPGWEEFETETILLELGGDPSDLLADKINVIRVFNVMPTLFYEDPLFFLHACEVFNGNPTDFETLPHITSLEAALAIVDASRLVGVSTVEESPSFAEPVRLLIREILIGDGYSKPVWPFDSVGITGLTDTGYHEDTVKKNLAIKEYLKAKLGYE
jgi:hypothetical protein